MKKIRVLWCGITGKTGQAVIDVLKNNKEYSEKLEIVAGICKNHKDYYTCDELDRIKEDFDIIIDFSHKDCFDKILNFAIKEHKPLISGTAGLSEEQINAFEKASYKIPIFRGGNFRFYVKSFIDSVVEYTKKSDKQEFEIVETHNKGKLVPSETAKVIVKKVYDETGKKVEIKSFLEFDQLMNDWRVDDLHCRVVGFKELAENILEIAIMMVDKKPDGVYDLDRLLDKKM